jgi:hypothetical protein
VCFAAALTIATAFPGRNKSSQKKSSKKDGKMDRKDRDNQPAGKMDKM